MFLNGLKVKSILRKLKEENDTRVPVTVGNKLKSIGIIEGNVGEFDRLKVKDLCKALEVKERDVYFMSFVAKKKKESKDNVNLFCSRDLGWKGVFKTPHLKEFGSKEVDLLISYYNKENLVLSAVSSLTKSKFKVGLKDDSYQTNDLIVATHPEKASLFIKELSKYLSILKIR